MRTLIVPLTVFLAACATAGAPAGDPSPTRVALEPGNPARVEGLNLLFSGVENDSRCPPRVQCIREGEARVVVQVGVRRQEMTRLALLTSPPDSTQGRFAGYLIRVDSLSPRPTAGEGYRLWLIVQREP